MERVIITIDKDGATEVKVECVKGAKCSSVSKAIEDALGTRTKDVATSEMQQKEQHATNKH